MPKQPTISEMKKTFREARASAKVDWTTRHSLFVQALQALFIGDEELMKLTLRDVINGHLGFEALAMRTGIPSKSIHRMLSKNGNPTSKNLFQIIRQLIKAEGFQIDINVKPRNQMGGGEHQPTSRA
jgi:DNA-binding phage protein